MGIDLGTGRTIGHRADERFPFGSSYKVFACAAVLDRARTSERDQTRQEAIGHPRRRAADVRQQAEYEAREQEQLRRGRAETGRAEDPPSRVRRLRAAPSPSSAEPSTPSTGTRSTTGPCPNRGPTAPGSHASAADAAGGALSKAVQTIAAASALGTGMPRTALSTPAPLHRIPFGRAGFALRCAVGGPHDKARIVTPSLPCRDRDRLGMGRAAPATARSPDGLPRGAADGRVTGAVTTRHAPDDARDRRDAGAARSRRPHTTAGPIRPVPGTGTRVGAPGSTQPCAAR